MTLAETLLRQLDDPTLSHDVRAQLRCRIAADLEHRGCYEAACDALGELWRGVGQRPALEKLSELTAAEVLLRAGTLSGWLGSIQQIEGVQDASKDLISESIALFQSLEEKTKLAISQSELGLCYRRAGAYDEARVLYDEALKNLADSSDQEIIAKVLLRLVTVESCSGRYNDSLRLLTDATRLFEESSNNALKGKFHNELGLVLRKLGTAEHRPDYTDRAIIEYTAASHYFELAGHTSYHASAENNLGFLLYLARRYREAHEHLNRARVLFLTDKNKGRIAQVDDARARVLLAEGRTRKAARASRDAVRTLEKGGEQALLAEALTTQGQVLSKSGNFTESLNTLRRAADLAEQVGAVEDAGRALLTLLEEHADRISEFEVLETYQRADSLLKGTQDAEMIEHLRVCAGRIVATRLAVVRPHRGRSLVDFWANFNLSEKVQAYEARYVQRALVDAEGSVTRAARLLGLSHHATLQAMLDEEGRHKDLAHLRIPREPRRQSIFPGEGRRFGRRRRASKPRGIRILHAEDSPKVADAVRDTLQDLGWKVETCPDAAEVMRRIESKERYDLMIFDNDLGQGASGLDILRRARQLPHRKRTPIIMLSAVDIEPQAWGAGASAFLRKSHDIGRLTATVTRLLSKDTTGK
jgi:tetratricopeptide (TPR) repeat protein